MPSPSGNGRNEDGIDTKAQSRCNRAALPAPNSLRVHCPLLLKLRPRPWEALSLLRPRRGRNH
eukprot:3007206-Pyramimonas_sp.AAC.1